MENPVILLFLALGIIIAAARIGGTIARFFDQPRVLGELIIGILLGPTVLNILNSTILGTNGAHLETAIHELAELGVLLLMFNVGLEVHISELLKVGRVAVIAGIIGALLPVVVTLPITMLFGYAWQPALFAGVTLAATSVSISAQVLLELGVLKTKEGNALLATALIDDVVAILLVSLTLAVTTGSGQSVEAGELISIIVRMSLYIGIAFVVAWFILPRFINLINDYPAASQAYGIPAFALVMALLFGWSAEHFGGVAPITGAFLAGIGLSRAREGAKRQIETAVSNIAYAFLVPVFFVSVGLNTDLRTFPLSELPLAAALLVVAVTTKVVGAGVGALWGGFNRQESLRLGVCMISRGEVGLIIVALGVSRGIFKTDDPLFASLFLVIILTTLLTPLLVRRVFQPAPQTVSSH